MAEDGRVLGRFQGAAPSAEFMERLRLSGIPVSPGLFDEVVSIPIDHEAIPPHIAATVIVVPNVLCRGNGAVGSVWRLLFPESRRSAVFHFQADAAHLCCAPSHVNMNGWELSVTENLNRWFGGTLDIIGYYGSPAVGSVTTRDHIYSILYGPKFMYRKDTNIGAPGRLIFSSVPFAHILFGGAHTSATVGPPGPHASDFSFAMALGGGLDWPLTPDASVRLFQLDYLRTNALGAGQNNYRASIGVVLRLGKPK